MKPLRGTVWSCALLLLGVSAAPADAAWCNVFQVCWHRQRQAAYYAPPAPCCAPNPCCQPQCTTSYVQRCYYQPVTCYQTKTYYEPVTTYRTSYYYEPVTSYTYSCYYDPCTCSYQQVATPCTKYCLKSQCCPVQSWVQRCCSVPVTTYQQSFYWEPVTTCCNTTVGAAVAPPADCPTQPPVGYPGQPRVSEPGARPGPNVSEGSTRPPVDGFQRYQQDTMPRDSGSSYRQLLPNGAAPARQTIPASQPPVRLDRIAAGPANEVQGKVVRGDKQPLGGARLLFISSDRKEPRRSADTDADGQFHVQLASGGWLVYIQGADGKPVFHRKIEVNAREPSQVYLVSR